MSRSGTAVRSVIIATILLLPGYWYVRIPTQWEARRAMPVTGDEPHYLVLADAIANDHSVQVKAAYDRDAESRRIYGPIDWENHTRRTAAGTFSIHSLGLAALIAIPFKQFGVTGVRVVLSILAAAVPFLLFGIARTIGLDRPAAVVLALCSGFSLPFLAASGQVFPDLPTGVILLALCFGVLVSSQRPLGALGLTGMGIMPAILPWFHLKNVLPAAILALGLVVIEGRRSLWRDGLKRGLWCVVPALCSVILLACYNHAAFGSVAGPYSATDAGATLRQATMIFLGLHFDQAHGIFAQQPLFLLALPGIGIFFRKSPVVACTVVATYVSVLVPNSIHPCWYGCASLSGRFMWSIAALWFFPLAVILKEMRPAERLGFLSIGVVATFWQISMMHTWRAQPGSLYTEFRESLATRNSLFPLAVRRWLPSFYDFQDYLKRGVNLLGMAMALTMVAVGVWRDRSRGRAKQHFVFSIAVPLVAVAIAVGIHAQTSASIDLVARFSQAELRPRDAGPEKFRLLSPTIQGETRSAILANPPSRIVWNLPVPRDAQLLMWLGVEPAPEPGTSSVLFRIGAGDESGYADLFTKIVDARAADGQRWIAIAVDLSRYGAKEASIVFNTESPPPGRESVVSARPCWGMPTIRTY